jgi:pyrroloquinoline-quinone synthase
MDIKTRLDTVVAEFNLLNSPFYQAWNKGELSTEHLATYAREYGAFISTLPLGWETQNDEETAEEEREHIELWEDFSKALNTKVTEASNTESKKLVALAKELFSERATALGALYAFEVQQPDTASSKLKGLQEHYSLDKISEPYFVEHSKNHHEAVKIIDRLSKLDTNEQDRAEIACKKMSKALWDTLGEIYSHSC